MIATLRSALLALALAACATTPTLSLPLKTAAADTDRHGEACARDRECPGGSCRAGICSWVAPEPQGLACRHDEQCFAGAGTCRAGQCVPGPADRTFFALPRGR